MFTVEQVELLRRLRNSGLTKSQICMAYDSMERLDRELGTAYATQTTTRPNGTTNGPLTVRQIINEQKLAAAANVVQQSVGVVNGNNSNGITSSPSVITSSASLSSVSSQGATTLARKPSIEELASELSSTSSPCETTKTTPTKPRDLSDQLPIIPAEKLSEFLQNGERHCCEEIRAFVLKYRWGPLLPSVFYGVEGYFTHIAASSSSWDFDNGSNSVQN